MKGTEILIDLCFPAEYSAPRLPDHLAKERESGEFLLWDNLKDD